ncbi:MAG: polysaccharide biosynthesis tyrosine autokinase [Deltaproteobacteria bacterium]|nr:polysaccharide biosynthesis tyrosine autokinase [Deltaproteobacteria bacterium]
MADSREQFDNDDFMDMDIEDTINIRDYVRTVVKRWRLITAVWGAVAAAGLIYCLTATPIYEATSGIIIDKEENDRGSLQEAVFTDTSGAEYYQTMYKILESRSVALNVIERLGLDKNKAFAPQGEEAQADNDTREELLITALQANLKIAPAPKSHYVNINYRSTDPALAAAIANALVEAYREHAFAMKLDSVQNSVQWLKDNLAQERKKVETAEQALLSFREQYNIVMDFSSDTETITAQKLAQLNGQVVEAETARAEAETRYRQAAALLQKPEMLDSIPEVMANPLIQQIKTTEVGLVQRRSELSKKYGPLHPQMAGLQSELKTLQAKKEQEIGRIVSALDNTYKVTLAKENSLKEALAAQKTEAFSLNKKAIQYTGLYCEAEGAKAMYSLLLKRFKETSVTENLKIGNIRVVDRAKPPLKPVKPKKRLYMLIALMMGLAAGLAAAFFLEYMDDAVNVPDDITQQVRIPFLGSVPLIPPAQPGGQADNPPPEMVAALTPRSSISEAYRGIRTNLLLSLAATEPRIILVSSADAGAGKTTTACNIAVVLAHFNYRVVLIDCDLHRPQLGKLFNIEHPEGMTNLLVGGKTLQETSFATGIPNLTVIPSGPIPPNPSEMLGSPKMKAILDQLKQHFDKIIIDAPPAGAVTDPLVMAKFTDGVVLVVRGGRTERRAVAHAADNLKKIGAHVFGAVLNGVDMSSSGYYHYYHHYYHNYGYAYGQKAGGTKKSKVTSKIPFLNRRA